MRHVSFWPDFAISPLYFSLRLYERQSVKPARLNGCPGSFGREYYLLCSAKVLWKNFEPFLKNITSNLVVSCQLLTRFRHITSLFLATFVWTPVCQTSAAKWLPRLIWKWILSTMFSESIVKKIRADLKNITSNLVASCQLLNSFRHITSLFLATFVWTPVCQTSAAKCLPRLIWKGILSTMFSESIVKKLRAVFEKYYIKLSCVMSASDQISPYHPFISRYVCMNASLSNQRG